MREVVSDVWTPPQARHARESGHPFPLGVPPTDDARVREHDETGCPTTRIQKR